MSDDRTPPALSDRLAELAVSLGEPFVGAGNRPVHLDDPDVVWFVEHGALDVFLAERRDENVTSDYKHVLRAEAGRLVCGVDPGGHRTSLLVVAKGLPGTRLRRVPLASLPGGDVRHAVVDQIDAWLSAFAAAVTRDLAPRPRPDLLLGPGERLDAEAGSVLSVRQGVVWVAGAGDPAFLGTEEPDKDGAGLLPLTPQSWLTLSGSARVAGLSSRDMDADGRLLAALAEFHRLALGAEQLNRRLLLADEANLHVARTAHRHRDEAYARRRLFTVLDSHRPAAEGSGSALLAALELIGRHEGIVFRSPRRRRTPDGESPSLRDILGASGVRGRGVRLSPDDRWWLGDSGAMLGFHRDDHRPLALLPGPGGRYRAVDPVSGQSVRVNADRADAVERDAWFFYRPLPDDHPVGTKAVLRFAGKNLAVDFARFASAGMLAGIAMLMPAAVVGVLADWVLPAAAGGMLVQLAAALVAFAAAGALMHMLQGTALMRIEGRSIARIGAALWDRLLGLPSSFFRRFTAGELTTRVMVFQTLRDQVSGVVANALLSVVFLLPAFALIFLYDAALGWLSLGIGLFSLGMAVVFGLLQIAPQRRRHVASRELVGELFQFINGIGKLRSCGAERSAFAAWARKYREQKQAEVRICRLSTHLVAFSTAVPALASAALFGVALLSDSGALAIGDFLAVYAASMIFYTAVVALGESFEAIAAIVPACEQVQPILAAVPESRQEEDVSVELEGEVRFDHVSFRYVEHGPPILDDVSIHARPGEFVAIVGESGAGKSTLIRLALGLEEPSAGAVYYDGRGLARLDRRALRRQIGVVVQDGSLQPGNVLDNIIGITGELTIDDAWRAARLATVDGDINAMPMGMFTVVGDNSGTFSGGQSQRIRIAAALVRNPRIVVLDEATNWLDTESQAEVMQGVENLSATRIVVAHRLSTVRKADRIYVLQAGRVVQQGGFDELLKAEGAFRDLVRRQIA